MTIEAGPQSTRFPCWTRKTRCASASMRACVIYAVASRGQKKEDRRLAAILL